jgi:hypothetical protein
VKPPNERPDILLPDGMWVRCRFFAWGDRGSTEECEQHATVKLSEEDRAEFRGWAKQHPRAIIGLWPGQVHLCDAHERIIKECIGEGGWG